MILSTLAVSILYSVLETRMIEKREAKLSANYEAAKAKKMISTRQLTISSEMIREQGRIFLR